jgi:EmrB/QacA subfamily drug resistance transporter
MTSPASYMLPRAVKARALVGGLVGLLLAALDQTIVATSAPAIQKDLAIPPELYAWITMAYLVTSTVLVPIAGKLSDLHGRRPVLLAGVLIFLFGSLLCALAIGPATLIAARGLQGVGAAALFTGAFTVAADLFPPAQRARYSGLFGAVFSFASVMGPLVGGAVTDRLGWHWVFLVNLPPGIAALILIARMPRLGGGGGDGRRLDLAGAAALIAAVVPLLVGLTRGSGDGAPGGATRWSSPDVAALLALSLAGAVAFIAIERRARDPLVPLSLFASRTFALANLASFLVGGTFLASAVFLPLFAVEVLHASATTAGLTLMPLTLAMFGANLVAGQIVGRIGRTRAVLLVALAMVAAAYALLAAWLRPGVSLSTVRLVVVLAGLGLGPTIPIVVVAVQNAVATRDLGVATAATRFFRQLGSTAGIGILATVFAHNLVAGGGAPSDPDSLSFAVRSVYAVACAVAAAAFLVILRLPDPPLRRA